MFFFCFYILTATFSFRPNSNVNSCSVKEKPNKRMHFKQCAPVLWDVKKIYTVAAKYCNMMSVWKFFVRSLYYSTDVPYQQLHNFINSFKLFYGTKNVCVFLVIFLMSWVTRIISDSTALHYCVTENVCLLLLGRSVRLISCFCFYIFNYESGRT